ncbi:hypothetical protein AVEN_69018-1, partial [Araneus ventricosus]
DEDLTKNVDAAGISVLSLVHRDKVRYPSATKLSDTVWKGTTVLTNYSGLVYVIYGKGSLFHKQEAVSHLFQTPKLHLVIGLCPYEPGYTQSFLLLPVTFMNFASLGKQKKAL